MEELLFESGFNNIAGIDEVGRGSLAGPVVSAAVVLDKGLLINNPLKLNDSKRLSPKRRKELFNKIIYSGSMFSIGISTNNEIDDNGILNSTKKTMNAALKKINYDYAIIDSVDLDLNKPYINFNKADTISASVAAASIIAKVSRDSIMKKIYDILYPEYLFKNNKGYGSKEHIDIIKKIGISIIHRKTFKPNSEYAK
tara:strand:+ start:1071 stop:1664 length:594 start_codon:yes stop_codon:yes gene_type:complete